MEELFQFSIFDYNKKPFKIDKPIRLIELFAGIGSQAKSLKRLHLDFEHYRVCEFDKYAIASYNAVHGTNFVKSDIRQITSKDLGIVDTHLFTYLLTYSFPCQDLSIAGKQKGMAKGDNTRSGLLWEVERLLNECNELPQVLLMENVPQVHSSKNIEQFEAWLKFLEGKGYSNYWKDLNAKNFGIPQNRNRTFVVSILGDYTYEFPQKIPLKIRLMDLLEDNVDEKYYISNKGIEYVLKREGKYTQLCDESTEIAKAAITAVGNANWTGNFIVEPLCDVAFNLYEMGVKGFNRDTGEVLRASGICKTIQTMQGGNRQPKILEEPLVWDGYNQRIRAEKGTVGALTTNCGGDLKRNGVGIVNSLRIRKLTPKECWRLMGFDDEDFEKASKINSNTQLYKQAGNSIVVDVLYYIFKQMI